MTKVLLPGQNTAGQPGGYPALDGNSGLLVPGYTEITQSAAPATPAGGKSRVYVDTGGNIQLVGAGTQPVRRLVTDYGAVTAFPVAPTAGDTCTRTDVGAGGTRFYCAPGGTWRAQGDLVVCTSTTRPASTGAAAVAYGGLVIYETDTLLTWVWNSTVWARLGAGQWTDLLRNGAYNYSPPNGSAFVDLSQGNFTVTGLPVGRELEVEWKAPLVAAPASASLFLRLLLAGTQVDTGTFSTGSAPVFVPGRLTGSLVIPAGGSVLVQVQGYSGTGAALTSIQSGVGGGAVVLRYRVA